MSERLAVAYSNPVMVAAKNAYLPFDYGQQGEILRSVSGAVVRAVELDERQYDVRTFSSPETARAELDYALPYLADALGRCGLPQLVAYKEEEALVTEHIPGHRLEAVRLAEASKMSMPQFATIANVVDFALRAGVEVDNDPKNILYDPSNGFGFPEYRRADNNSSTIGALIGVSRAMMRLGQEVDEFDTRAFVDIRVNTIRMVTQSGFSILPGEEAIELAEATESMIVECRSGHCMAEIA